MNKNKFKPGQKVYINHLVIREAKTGQGFEVKGVIKEMEFYREIPNYLEKYGLHYRIGPIGKREFENTSAPYGTAYLPERVFALKSDAQLNLNQKILDVIGDLEKQKISFKEISQTLNEQLNKSLDNLKY